MSTQAQPSTAAASPARIVNNSTNSKLDELLEAKAAADGALAAELELEMEELTHRLAELRARHRELVRGKKRAVTVDVIETHMSAALAAHENGSPEALKTAVLERLRAAGFGPLTGIYKNYTKALERLGVKP